MKSKILTNYVIKENRISNDIDRTISQMMRKEELVENKDRGITINFEFGLTHHLDLNLIQDHLGSLKEVPNWYTSDLIKFKDDKYYRFWSNKCDCCGNYSPTCYCEKCRQDNYHRVITERVKDGDFQTAIDFIIRDSREKPNY